MKGALQGLARDLERFFFGVGVFWGARESAWWIGAASPRLRNLARSGGGDGFLLRGAAGSGSLRVRIGQPRGQLFRLEIHGDIREPRGADGVVPLADRRPLCFREWP